MKAADITKTGSWPFLKAFGFKPVRFKYKYAAYIGAEVEYLGERIIIEPYGDGLYDIHYDDWGIRSADIETKIKTMIKRFEDEFCKGYEHGLIDNVFGWPADVRGFGPKAYGYMIAYKMPHDDYLKGYLAAGGDITETALTASNTLFKKGFEDRKAWLPIYHSL